MTEPAYYNPASYLRSVKHVGQTYTEVKAERLRKRRMYGAWAMLAIWILALGVAAYEWVMR
jgi:hypothetical protein